MPDVPAPAASDPRGEIPTTVLEVRSEEILTGEAVALDVQPVGFFLRALGCLIDVLIAIVLFILFLLASSWLVGANVLESTVVPILTIVVLVLITVALPTTVETVTRGRSLGRLAVGSRIVRIDGGAAGFRHAFIRALVGVIEIWFTLGAIAAVVGAFTPRAQRLGDLLAGTYAERTRTPALPDQHAPLPPMLAEWGAIADVARLPDRLARRIAQFTRSAPQLEPAARERLAASLAAEAARYVSPVPAVEPAAFLYGVVAIRRDRELRALMLETQRVAALTAHADGVPRGFPRG